MDINTTEFANFINTIVEEKTKKIIDQKLNSFGIIKGWVATVESVNPDSTINVQLPNSTEIMSNLINKSGEVLIATDEVELHSISTLSNAYVAIKY